MAIEIHTKTGKETEVMKILEAWRSEFPERYKFFKSTLQELRKVRKTPDGSFVDPKGRKTKIAVTVPTDLWLFFKHRIPGWGDTYKDVELLLKVAGDYFKAAQTNSKRIFSTQNWKKRREKKDENLKRSNSKKRSKNDQGDGGEFEIAWGVGIGG